MDLRQTPEYARYLDRLGWIIPSIGQSTFGRERKTYIYIKKVPILGSIIKVQRPEKINFEQIDNLVKKYRAFQVTIEPIDENQVIAIKQNGYKISKSFSLPTKSIQVNLTKSENRLLSEMHHKTRYNIKVAKKNGVVISNSSDIKQFSNFWQSSTNTQRGKFLSQEKHIIEIYNAFGNQADLLLALHLNKLVAGILLLHTDTTSYYMYVSSSDEGKKLFAPTLVTWEAFRLSKKKAKKIFDFEGIYDERFPLKSWKGFTRFKKSFGGHEIEYPGCYSKIFLPFKF